MTESNDAFVTHDEKSDYWESYYTVTAKQQIAPPSQFAAFVAQEIGNVTAVVDVGCGAGRDSIFLAQRGLDVLGIDASRAAVERCTAIAAELRLPRAQFKCMPIEGREFADEIRRSVSMCASSLLIYTRFFLHAITESEQETFLKVLSRELRPSDRFAIEYRTTRDAALAKETSAHYRRYIDPAHLLLSVSKGGFEVEYAVEGFGFAKYRKDDAHVARAIFSKV